MSEENTSEISLNVFTDPLYCKSLLGKTIKVELINNKVYSGLFYCIDPVSESIVLVNKKGDKYDTDILLSANVKNIKILKEEVSNDVIFHTSEKKERRYSEDKVKIKNWLMKHLLNVEEDEDVLQIGDDLKIYPPYTIENCISTNTIILQRVQDIISKMPATL